MGATTSNPYEDKTPNRAVDAPPTPPPAPKPVVMVPKFQAAAQALNPFDTSSLQAQRYADTPTTF
tara:strand:- start:139 stop:333 length:195 start_codon:yes stop_codon:yes gene_type:complete